jgi:ADP-ribose pyrophosphatase YjhB (NUDIX family)
VSHEVNIHTAQIAILRELLFHPEAGFSELQKPTGLDSDHFKFHIARLVDLGFVEKRRSGKYSLTHKGKEHANKLDTDAHTIERQPKISVLVVGWRTRKDGEIEYLVQQRLKNPYFGFWGRIGGKIRWGETAVEAAARELKEETGLTADLVYRRLYHKMDYNEQTGSMLEDKFFITFVASKFRGTLIEKFEGGRNAWLTQAEINAQEKLFAGLDDSETYVKGRQDPFFEKKYYYQPDEY